MANKITLENVAELKAQLATLSRNVAKSAFSGSDEFIVWFEKGSLLFYADGAGNMGYFWTSIQEKNISPVYVLPRMLTTKVVSILPENKPVTMEFTDKGVLLIRAGEGMEFSIRIGAGKKKPKIDVPPALAEFDLSLESLKEIQRKVVPCCSSASINPVGLISQGGKTSILATDNHVMAKMELPINSGKDFQAATAVAAWSMTFPSNLEKVHYRITENFVIISGPNWSYLVSNLFGKLPPYDMVERNISKYGNEIRIEKELLLQAMKAMELMACSDTNIIKVSFGKEVLSLHTEDKDMGSIQMDVPYSARNKKDFAGKSVGFAYDFLAKGVNASENEVVIMTASPKEGTFPISPVKFDTGKGCYMVVCPIRLH